MRKPVWVWAVAVVGALAAAGMRIAGETQMFKVGVELWALPLLAGLLVPAVVMLAGWRRGRNARAVKEAVEGVKAEAREAHRTFVGRLDHELKNPLMALRVGLGEVRDPVLAESMRVQVDRLASLVAELRKISEIDSYPVADEPVDVSEVVSEVIETVVPGDREMVVAFPRAPRPLPPVRGDRDLVFLAIYNVVSNAVKYSSPGATLEVRGMEERGYVVVDVSDTGRGIPASEVDQVWGELARSKEVRHIPGNGLGLPMVAAVLRRLGGSCELSSIQGRGTTVRMRLPLL
ncbi:sensor histidine kinase [Arachnia propionica]|uniref:Sensor-like histidine kinase SenX3 n=1 Tax=Arachnia propionica TaxID=1750 RepID=A0A3N4CWI0_9ACTN|nr:HAMP domain-containing sensor histidine kinase [Arachnia propionica]AFN46417.1 ATPase/histidine kinase/DNA gyrase B/HSP90 domain protein [Arachnia propionica F0230a]QCT37038.1 HAMP domain-containing histidine kinase [Arachnia propionica]QUC10621.1 HAMP domain-containing histidine kinase [Arachnia propionica]RPA17511.1 sensor histidine kinase [Arachnia propionica]VEH69325.1 Sensor histidine kinase YycG [Arachnia propionica]